MEKKRCFPATSDSSAFFSQAKIITKLVTHVSKKLRQNKESIRAWPAACSSAKYILAPFTSPKRAHDAMAEVYPAVFCVATSWSHRANSESESYWSLRIIMIINHDHRQIS